MNQRHAPGPDGWLEQAFPQVHHFLLALDGDRRALGWLNDNSKGISLLARALGDKPGALAALRDEGPADLDDLFDLIDNDDLARLVGERQPDLGRLIGAVRGDEGVASELKRQDAPLGRVAGVVRELYDGWRTGRGGVMPLDNGSAADMGCLIGEMHLRAGEFERAIEAFTRAIDAKAEADLHEGRARAYRALAEADERRAELLRAAR